jgi:hypothetical protein
VTAGDALVIFVGTINPSARITSISDSLGNSFSLAYHEAGGVSASGPKFNNRVITSPDGDLFQDKIVTGKTGPLSDGATLGAGDYWVSQLVSFN